MKKHLYALDDLNIKRFYILTRPTQISNLSLDDLEDVDDYNWKNKARRLQARRWRKIKHQLA